MSPIEFLSIVGSVLFLFALSLVVGAGFRLGFQIIDIILERFLRN